MRGRPLLIARAPQNMCPGWTQLLHVELNTLCQRQGPAIIDRIGRAAHIALPGIRTAFTAAAGFFFATMHLAAFGFRGFERRLHPDIGALVDQRADQRSGVQGIATLTEPSCALSTAAAAAFSSCTGNWLITSPEIAACAASVPPVRALCATPRDFKSRDGFRLKAFDHAAHGHFGRLHRRGIASVLGKRASNRK